MTEMLGLKSGGERSAQNETGPSSSVLGNPFTDRESKSLTWKNINMILAPSNKKDKQRHLLQDVWGEAPPRKITAIAGPSGAGKTSLLNILSGRQATKGRITVEYDIRLGVQEVKTTKMAYRSQIAFVAQDISLPISATPRECIKFSAKLRLPASMTDKEIDQLTAIILDELGLLKCADTVVGGPLLKGISGGEKKRTSVGVELVTRPSCIFLDEPTSGLDSFSAVQLISVLKKVAELGASVLFTIHQPSSAVFETFDHFILMNYGGVMYQGSVENLPEYFAQRGNSVPLNYNPADFIMDVAQRFAEDELKQMGYFPADLRKLPPALSRKSSVVSDANDYVFHHVSMLTEMKLLYVRELKSMARFTMPLKVRFGFATIISVLIGAIFLRIGSTDTSVPKNFLSHFSGLGLSLMSNMIATTMSSLLSFPLERPIFLREYTTGHYSVTSYFFSKLTIEAFITLVQVFLTTTITFYMMNLQQMYIRFVVIEFMLAMATTALGVMLGCTVENPETATELLDMILIPQYLFAGLLIATDLIPPFIRWIQYLCPLMYSIRLAIYYEFGNCAYQTCQELLAANYVKSEDIWWYWLVLVSLFVLFRLVALIFLRKRATQSL